MRVNVTAPSDGQWKGMLIYQGSDPAISGSANLQLSATKCDGRNVNLTDVVFAHNGNGLNAFSGTIYAPAQDALFNDSVSGTANLAVITGCIFINGANSTFNFQSSGLFGISATLGG